MISYVFGGVHIEYTLQGSLPYKSGPVFHNFIYFDNIILNTLLNLRIVVY